MAAALEAEGITMTTSSGLNPAPLSPDSKVTINQMIDAIVAKGRDPYPRKVRFTTWTLAYNQMKWVTVDTLGKHWERRGAARRGGDSGPRGDGAIEQRDRLHAGDGLGRVPTRRDAQAYCHDRRTGGHSAISHVGQGVESALRQNRSEMVGGRRRRP